MFKRDYDQIIREHFDLSDRTTRQYIATLEDAGQEQLLNALSSALYDKIVTKVDDIDFGTIPMSRGDITKVDGFTGTEECLAIIRRLVLEYKQNTGVVDVVLSAIQNIKDRKALFIKGYSLNVELPMLIYNTMVLSIERSTSLMIATCIEYIKDPASSSPKAALNKVAYNRTMDDVLFKSLINFNNICANGSIDKVLDLAMKHPVKEDVAMQYGTVTPIDEEEPNAGDDIQNPVDSAITPDNTIEPFGNDPEVPVADDEPEEYQFPTNNDYDDNDIDGDTTSNDNECGGSCGTRSVNGCGDVPCDAPVQEDESDTPVQITSDVEEPVDNTVDPDNIPAVIPGEDIASSDTPITEDDDHQSNAPDTEDVAPTKNDKNLTPQAASHIQSMEMKQKLNEGVISAIGGFFGLIINTIVGLIRSTVYGYYYTKLKVSDYLAVQADLLEANAYDLKYSSNSTLSDEERKNVVKKQLNTVQKLRKWSNKFALDSKATSNKVNAQINKDDSNKKKIAKDDDYDYSIF